jgi:alpha-L-fucosidase 2
LSWKSIEWVAVFSVFLPTASSSIAQSHPTRSHPAQSQAAQSHAERKGPSVQSASRARVDYAGLIGRSDIVLARANAEANQAMPLGNGRLGVAVWSADGLTAQLNRVDTLPDRVPVARVNIPGLATLTAAKDYSGRLDLYNAEFRESGAGISASVYVESGSDNLIIDVTGAAPGIVQTATVSLVPPRAPKAAAAGATGILSETWRDDWQPGASGRAFGSLAAVTAEGREVSAKVTDPHSVTVSFKPFEDGHFRVVVAGPHFNAEAGTAESVAAQTLAKVMHAGAAADEVHREWWHRFWQHAGYMKIGSPDGAGEYMENLRALYLYSAAAESGSEYPGSQAGVGDMFSSVLQHMWAPASFWHWNLRMQVAANLSAGIPEMNAPYFNLYRENLAEIEQWTKAHMDGRPGICVPETMRFNGRGIEYENWGKDSPGIALNCDSRYQPYYNARTISTGAEISLWIWQQYLLTNDREFLARNFPVMAAATRFLMAYETPGKDGLMHTTPSNAHELQWDTLDPVTDLSARMALYKATLEATQVLGNEAAMAGKLRVELTKIPALPRTQAGTAKSLLSSDSEAADNDVIAVSYVPVGENKNVENIGLEPVWPYNLIGDTSPQSELARRTYLHRPYPTNQDWSYDPIQAARLGMPDEVRSTLIKLTQTYQTFVNGFANWGGKTGEFYVEQQGVVAAALQEALVQDYDGVIRINPAFPKEWDADGQVAVRGKTRVDVQIRGGVVQAATIEAGTTQRLKVRNPWGEAEVEMTVDHQPALKLKGKELEFPAIAGRSYLLTAAGNTSNSSINEGVTGTAATTARKLGAVQIGIFVDGK